METRLFPSIAYDNAKEALAYYEEVFGATAIHRLSPTAEQAVQMGIPESTDLDTVTVHATFNILGVEIQAGDSFGADTSATDKISLMISVNSEDPESMTAADAFYERLTESNEVTIVLPYEDQFWGGKLGQFKDKYGINWMLHANHGHNFRKMISHCVK
ncbi:VOC family protein [Enterococcus xiangfangensis]|uniref:VOC family protein n=1 Tax=Enterococcus xiangfangensis TaxID=1296537 RepID=UPI0010F6180A|nr:glyoxalase/bleomycin resistance/extradiol dioxygenase family protein [Enterococcus xiangfangensis]MBM7712275.1 PhnB protein [Enterococcus xiangfangensis]NBK08753.1 VOC family protein [Enterococcus asini]